MWISLVLVFPFRVKCCISSTSKEESTFHTYISVSVFIFSKEKDRGAADVKRKDNWGIKKATHRQFYGLSGTLTVSSIVLLQNTEMQPHAARRFWVLFLQKALQFSTRLFFSAIFGDTFVIVFGSMSDITGTHEWMQSWSLTEKPIPLILHAGLFDQPLAESLTWPSWSERLSLEPRQDLLCSLLLWFKKECSFFQFHLLYSWSVCFHNLW